MLLFSPTECGFAYCEGEPSDEAAHRAHHRKALQGMHVRGALAERRIVCERDGGGRIIALHATDGTDALRKVREAKGLLDAELGSTPDLPDGPARRVAYPPLLATQQVAGYIL